MAEYQDATLQALGQLTELQPGQSVSLADIFEQVAEDLQLALSEEKDRSRAYVSVSKALSKLRSEGLCTSPKRGQWGITRDGIRQCTAEGEDSEEPQSTWREEDDAYLLSLAVKKVRCLGWYRGTSKFCPDCYVSKLCRQHYLVHLQREMGILLGLQAEARRVSVDTRVLQELDLEEDERKEDSFEDLLAGLDETHQKNHPNQKLVERLVAEGHTVQVVPLESVCAYCGEIIPAKSTVIWDSGQGNAHLTCWEERL